jgi:tellurite resistance protein TerC
LNNGEAIKSIPEISTELSLGFILVTLVVTTVVSLIATSEKRKSSKK